MTSGSRPVQIGAQRYVSESFTRWGSADQLSNQVAQRAEFLLCTLKGCGASVKPLGSLAGCMPALALGNTRWWQLPRTQGAAKPRHALPCCAGCRESLRDSFTAQKSPAGGCRWFSLSLSLLCSTKEAGQPRERVLQILAPRVILSINISTCCTVICPEVLWNIAFPSHVNGLPVDLLSIFVWLLNRHDKETLILGIQLGLLSFR